MPKQLFKQLLQKEFVILDGAMGTMLLTRGLKLGENPEVFALRHPEVLRDIHRAYIDAGADVIYACTFGANRLKLADTGHTPAEVINANIRLAREAAGGNALVALDIGSLGELMEPAGTLSFETAYDCFKEMLTAGEAAGADMAVLETFTSLHEMKAAVLAAKENTNLPIICSLTFDKNNRTFNGDSVEAMACMLSALGIDAIGINCSPGPRGILEIMKELAHHTNLPLLVKANAGLPDPETKEYALKPAEFATEMREFAALGVQMLGGCCGTTPTYIATLKQELAGAHRAVRAQINEAAVCSATQTVYLDAPQIVGERLNPTGKKMLQQALREHNFDYIAAKALEQQQAGAAILDINVGLPGLNEAQLMPQVVKAVQAVVDLPLQIDSADPAAIEAGLRAVNGKAIVNSVNGKNEILKSVLPLVKKYGAAVIGLTLDENGIPPTAEARLTIARHIMTQALAAGIPKEDIYIDCLTLTVSAQQEQARETLNALRRVKQELGLKTALGVSNISFGLPNRGLINRTFLAMALEAGLDLAIINPNAPGMSDTVAAFKVLNNQDHSGVSYIATQTAEKQPDPTPAAAEKDPDSRLTHAIAQGLKSEVQAACTAVLAQDDELSVINRLLIPALDEVGKRYEREEIYLPQLINAAAAAGAAFDLIKERIAAKEGGAAAKGRILMATVYGDIHDIGKNIVKVILANYGYQITDLGRDVPAEKIVQTAIEQDIKLIGLSALMTTTVASMQQTIEALRQSGWNGQIFVGGAVLTPEYAAAIGADFYAKDAMQSVEIAKRVLG
ncbi:MAG TPA: homocysteine S-methyltransferase family protein [Candidatus Avidehalobacter gallistercoris]|uniref:Methionine synthase n=1 Tax=Candidatus Avidehalobacter gallistercoris TaxID=2840694 RepID=A0A9D1KXB8_9FIRM|nr:homocysteine S-methyltransferase family protein [Candidatus Avidehalobacter gallistercoris]